MNRYSRLGERYLPPRLGVGTLFRLYAHKFLPNTTGSVLYSDNDVVFLNNLNALVPLLDEFQASNRLIQAGIGWDVCAGFVFLNLPRLHEFFPIVKNLSNDSFPANFESYYNDQFVMLQVKKSHPDLVSDMPKEWYIHLAHGFRRNVHLLKEKRTNIAMLHFNGMRKEGERWWEGGVWYYCDESESCKHNATIQQHYRETWNLAEYYVHLPWDMTKFQGAAIAGKYGHPLQLSEVEFSE